MVWSIEESIYYCHMDNGHRLQIVHLIFFIQSTSNRKIGIKHIWIDSDTNERIIIIFNWKMKNFIISNFEDNVRCLKRQKQTTDKSQSQYTNSDGITEISVAFSRQRTAKTKKKKRSSSIQSIWLAAVKIRLEFFLITLITMHIPINAKCFFFPLFPRFLVCVFYLFFFFFYSLHFLLNQQFGMWLFHLSYGTPSNDMCTMCPVHGTQTSLLFCSIILSIYLVRSDRKTNHRHQFGW